MKKVSLKKKMHLKWERLVELYGSQVKAQRQHEKFEAGKKVKYPKAHKNYQKAEQKYLAKERKAFVKKVT